MTGFLVAAAGFILATVALGLYRILRGPGRIDRMMAAQLVGSGGIAVLALVAIAVDWTAIVDVALMLALLSAFSSVGFVKDAYASRGSETEEGERR